MITRTDNRGQQVVKVSVGHWILAETSDMMTTIKLVRVRVGVTRLVTLFCCLVFISRAAVPIYI